MKSNNYFNYYSKSRSGLKDIWNSYMCNDSIFSNNDIPFCPTTITDIPKDIITWEEAKQHHRKTFMLNKNYICDKFVCFYLDDYKFDGARSSVWLYPERALVILKHFKGIITPDFSTYQDFPYPLKIWNTYRMRAFGYWISKHNIEVINNVRWGTPETYEYCFDGIQTNSTVAIGTVGGNPKKLINRERFETGLKEMIIRLTPHTIIVYGSAKYDCFNKIKEQGIKIISFDSSTARRYKEK